MEDAKKIVVAMLRKKIDVIYYEHGSYDPSTNSTELSDKYEDLVSDIETSIELVKEL